MRTTIKKGQREIVAADPMRCRMWEGHHRLLEFLTEESCRQEFDSFRKHGQLLPAIARRLFDDPECDFELVAGARRLFVARTLGVVLQVDVRELSDRDAIVAMEIENLHRKEVSHYERGLSYKQWLQAGYFGSQEELAHALGISASKVCRLIQLARLPAVIVNAFETPLDLKEYWGHALMDAWEDERNRRLIAERARAAARRKATSSAAPQTIFDWLISKPCQAPRSSRTRREEIVRNQGGAQLFRVKYSRNSVSVVLPSCGLSAETLDKLKQTIVSFLTTEGFQKWTLLEKSRKKRAARPLTMGTRISVADAQQDGHANGP